MAQSYKYDVTNIATLLEQVTKRVAAVEEKHGDTLDQDQRLALQEMRGACARFDKAFAADIVP